MFTEEQQKAIDKVRKLMSLSEGSTSYEEAQTAAMMARNILSKYNLNITDIKTYRVETNACELKTELRTRNIPVWVKSLSSAVSKVFDCEYLLDQMEEETSICFIGVEPNITICNITFSYLYEYLDCLCFPKGYPVYMRNSYRQGFAAGILEKHKATKAEEASTNQTSSALVVVQHQLIDEFMKTKYPDLRTVYRRRTYVSTSAYDRGFKDGINFEYRKFLDEKS